MSLGSAGAFVGAPGKAPLPLLLLPAYFVPLFVMLHIAALLQSRRLKRNLACPQTRL